MTRPCISDVRATEDLGRDFDPDAVVNGQNPEFTDFHLWPRLLAGLGRSDPADGRIPRFGERSDVATVALREELTAVGVELLSWTTGTPPRTWLVRALFLPPESEMSLRVLSARTCCSTYHRNGGGLRLSHPDSNAARRQLRATGPEAGRVALLSKP